MNKSGIYCMLVTVAAFLIVSVCLFSARTDSHILTDQINTPTLSEVTQAKSDSNTVITNSKLNINLATAKELEMLPGIGEVLAQRIIEFRTNNGPFNQIEELLQVKGIGPAKLNAIRDFITTK